MRILKFLAAVVAAILVSTVFLASPAQAVKATDTGHKHVTVTQTADGQLAVAWNPTKGVKYYQVKTSSTPDMVQNVKTYKVSKSVTAKTVAPTRYAVAGTGNYTFVRVYAVKKNGKTGESPYVQVRMNAAAPTVPDAETVATFNVRTAETDVAGHSWSSRVNAVASQIQQSGAAVVALQEAGAKIGGPQIEIYQGSDGHKHQRPNFYWQFEQVRDKVGGGYELTNDQEYSPSGAPGKEGTRILYDTAKVTMVDQGFFAPSAVDKYLRFVPWALFQDNVTGKQFYFVAVHLDNRDTEYKLRLKQINTVIAKIKGFAGTGHQVILAGDLNSNIYSRPANVVDQKLISAGFFDSYATADNINEFFVTFNDFSKPKKSASRTDYIMTYGGPTGSFAYKNWIVRSGTIPSDHYMQSATVPIQ